MMTDDDGFVDLEEARRSRGRGFARSFRVLTAQPTAVHAFPVETIPERRWIYGRRLMRGAVTMLIAPPGTGKSMLTIQDALCIAAGRGWFGFDVHEPGPVWLYNAEEPKSELDRRLVAAMQHMKIEWDEIVDQLFVDSGLEEPWDIARLGDNNEVEINEPLVLSIISHIKGLGIAVLWVDPLVEVHSCNENDNVQMRSVVDAFRRIATEADCAVCIVHHTRKMMANSTVAGDLDSARGASALGGKVRIAETLYTMSPADAERLGIDDAQRRRHVRLDDAKRNYAATSEEVWLQFEGVEIGNGDEVGVLVLSDIDEAKRAAALERHARLETIVKRIIPVLREAGGAMTLNRVCLSLIDQVDSPFKGRSAKKVNGGAPGTVRREVEEAVRLNIVINDQVVHFEDREIGAGQGRKKARHLVLGLSSENLESSAYELL